MLLFPILECIVPFVLSPTPCEGLDKPGPHRA